MSGHTPGPWTGFLSERARGEPAWFIGPPSAHPIVAYVEADEEDGLTGARVEANARLIAAAPELLDLIKRIAQWDSLDGAADGPFWKRECARAIAKAEGITP